MLLYEYEILDDHFWGAKRVIFGGEAIPVGNAILMTQKAPEIVFYNGYGTTETMGGCIYYAFSNFSDKVDCIPIGAPMIGVTAQIIDENDCPVKKGDIGELCVQGDVIANGYYEDLNQTKMKFIQNKTESIGRMYKTGDLVKENDNGDIVYVGRIDNQIQHNGYRVELEEIEANAKKFEGINESACIYDPSQRKIVMYYCGRTAEMELNRYMKSRIPSYMVPNEYIKLEKLPHISNGKIDRVFLKKLWDDSL